MNRILFVLLPMSVMLAVGCSDSPNSTKVPIPEDKLRPVYDSRGTKHDDQTKSQQDTATTGAPLEPSLPGSVSTSPAPQQDTATTGTPPEHGVTSNAVVHSPTGASPTHSGIGNKTVHVSGYTRANGTQVSSHDRAAPGTSTSYGGFGSTGRSHGGSAGS